MLPLTLHPVDISVSNHFWPHEALVKLEAKFLAKVEEHAFGATLRGSKPSTFMKLQRLSLTWPSFRMSLVTLLGVTDNKKPLLSEDTHTETLNVMDLNFKTVSFLHEIMGWHYIVNHGFVRGKSVDPGKNLKGFPFSEAYFWPGSGKTSLKNHLKAKV